VVKGVGITTNIGLDRATGKAAGPIVTAVFGACAVTFNGTGNGTSIATGSFVVTSDTGKVVTSAIGAWACTGTNGNGESTGARTWLEGGAADIGADRVETIGAVDCGVAIRTDDLIIGDGDCADVTGVFEVVIAGDGDDKLSIFPSITLTIFPNGSKV
jgi:hypothetical protein